MKMFKLMGKRGFAVFTSLALCASLVAPSFAASFWDLQNAINGTYEGDAFTVTEDDNGRSIKLNESVERGDPDTNDAQGNIGFGKAAGKNLTLDLNGHEINANGVGTALYVNSTVNLTIKDSSEEGTGKITGGVDSGVKIDGGGKVTLESGAITGNTAGASGVGGGVKVDGNGTFNMEGGEISGNTAGQYGGGVYVAGNGTFNMDNDSEISGNTAGSSGGGVGVEGANASFAMGNGTISGNVTGQYGGNDSGGGGVWIKSGAKFTMEDGEITENKVLAKGSETELGGNGGGVAIHQAKFEMSGGKIANNESARGTGVLINAGSDNGNNASFTMSGGYTAGQDGKSCIYLEESSSKDATFTLSGSAVLDGTIRLGKGTQVITKNVKDPNSEHKYTDFDMMVDEKGSDKLGPTIGTGETETKDGYEAEAETFLDINYNHEWDTSVWVADSKNHGRPCKHCQAMTAAEPHSWEEEVTKAATCTETGVKTLTCSVCGYSKTETIPANGHTWDDGEVTTEPTCTEEGVKTFTCSVCHATNPETEIIPVNPNNHTGIGEFVDNGDDHHKVCSACDKEVETAAHIWNGGVVTTEATAGADGVRTYTCTVCGATKTEPIPYTPDTIIEEPVVPLAPLPDEVEIDDPEVPLAGLLTRADVIGYLWEHSGSQKKKKSK